MRKISTFIHSARHIALVLLLSVLSCLAIAQDSKGTEFWICFPGNEQSPQPELYITGDQVSTVTISIPGIGFNQVVNVAAGGLQVVSLPVSAQVQSQFVADNKGIHITATNPVTVYGMNAQQATTDAFLAFPLDAIGSEYYVLGYNKDFSNPLPTQATIVATQNNTAVTITTTVTGGGFTVNVPGTITLQKGEVYQLRSTSTNADYSGTKVTANKPISIFGGAQCTNISLGIRACDHLVEQLPPLSSWGKSFLSVPLATRLAGDVFRFLAQRNNTVVTVNGAVVANLNAGQLFETILSSTSYNRISSNEPILVGQYSRSSQADGIVSDPFFALVPPDEQFLNSYVVSAGTNNIPSNFLNITSPTSNVGTVRVDGTVVTAALWTSIGTTGFSGAKVSVGNGVHAVTSALPIGLLVYGFGNFDSYGYLGGQSFSPVATVNSLVLTPATGSGAITTNQCFTATVRDQFNAAVVGVRVDFGIIGVNNSASGFANTNASGIATFCYAGANPGVDNITASVGSISDASVFTWTNTCNVQLTTMVNAPACNAGATGSIDLSVTGGTPPYTYQWSNSASSQDLTGLRAGTYTVTVTDSRGCTATTTSTLVDPPLLRHGARINPSPTVPGQAAATIYLGYGPQSVTITATGSGGTGAISFDWGVNGTNAAITVSPTVTTTYTCLIKDSKGCTKVCPVKITVIDVRCGANLDQVMVCHKVPGTNTSQLLCVASGEVAGYLAAGDKLGACSMPGGRSANARYVNKEQVVNVTDAALVAYPNPATNFVDVQWKAVTDNSVVLNVFDVKGVRVMTVKAGNSSIKRLDVSKLVNGVYLLQLTGGEGEAITTKFEVRK